MIIRSLSGTWTLEASDRSLLASPVPAAVPGSVYAALLAAGRMEDPHWRDNEFPALGIMDGDFTFSRRFTADGDLLACRQVLLRCEGLDTVAEIRINGRLAGQADNMHRIYEFDIAALLRPGDNTIGIRFDSPVRTIRSRYAATPVDGTRDAMRGFPLLRKAHCMFGWDWGPRLPDAGIWREIALVGISGGRLGDVRIHQEHLADGRVRLDAVCAPGTVPVERPAEWRFTVTGPGGEIWSSTGERRNLSVVIGNPRLWWPNGLGDQPLYGIRVELLLDGLAEDRREFRIGLRTLTVVRRADEWGESFFHCVNGTGFFAMGADYIPEDNLLSRVTPERTRRLLEDAAAAHHNVIRVWGGGYYPDDFFYDACDELGLVVWQDFMFACANYLLTPEFSDSIRAEFTDNIRRLRHHASLGLWCGNNEMEMFQEQGAYNGSPRLRSDYIRMFEHILPEVLAREDPDTFYWPASPSSGGGFDVPNDPNRGDTHYWEVWHGGKPFTDYRKHFFRYASEFGFQSFPCRATVERFTLPEDRNVFSRVMEMHQRNAAANGKIMNYLAATFRYPTDFDQLLYASQLLQAEAIRYGVEHWRRHRGRCMGAVVWQLNDIWPVASWSSIDYYGRWKALHYLEKRFFAPIAISCEEHGELDGRLSCVDEPAPLEKSARLAVANETRDPFRGRARWSLHDPDAAVLLSGELPVAAPAFSSVWLDFTGQAAASGDGTRLLFDGLDELGCYLSYELLDDAGALLSSGTSLFCAPKHFRFRDPDLRVRLAGRHVCLEASAYARGVEIVTDDPDCVFEDNYFDMNGGTRTIAVLRGSPRSLGVRSIRDIGR